MVFKSHDPYELRIQMEQRSCAMENRIMAPILFCFPDFCEETWISEMVFQQCASPKWVMIIQGNTSQGSCPIINESQKHQDESFELQWPKYLICWMFHFWSIRLVRVPPRLSSAIGRQFGLWHPPRVGTGHAKRCFQKEQFRDNFMTLLKWSACFGRGELNILNVHVESGIHFTMWYSVVWLLIEPSSSRKSTHAAE